jgi:hypothetical protein
VLFAITAFFGFLTKPTTSFVLVGFVLFIIGKAIVSLPKQKTMQNTVKTLGFATLAVLIIVLPTLFSTDLLTKAWDHAKLSDKNYTAIITADQKKFAAENILCKGIYGTDVDDPFRIRGTWNKYCQNSRSNSDLIKQTLKSRSLKGHLTFFYQKDIATFASTNFGGFADGNQRNNVLDAPAYTGHILKTVHDYQVGTRDKALQKQYENRASFQIFRAGINWSWYFVLFLMAAGVAFVFTRKRLPSIFPILYTSATLFIIYETIFESRSRYLVHYLPLFIVMACFMLSPRAVSRTERIILSLRSKVSRRYKRRGER